VSATVGRNVRTAREKRRLTQGELGDLIGGTQSMVMNIETARTQLRVEQLVAIAAALNVKPAALLKGTDA
jgi:transcriptional regulator with XRE-family HTH domain